MAEETSRLHEARTRSGPSVRTRTPDLFRRVRQARERLEPEARRFARTRPSRPRVDSWTTWPYTPA